MPSNNVKSGGSSDQDAIPDGLQPSRQHSTPTLFFRVCGGIQSAFGRGAGQGEEAGGGE